MPLIATPVQRREAFTARYGPWALVTGASAGIGAEFSRQLAARGLNLVLVARRADALQALAQELSSHYAIEASVLPCDLAAPEALGIIAAATDALEIGLLVNNAGAPSFHGHFVEREPAEVEQLVQFNTRVQVLLCHHFLRRMAGRRRGGLIQVASITGHVSMPFMVEYSAGKAYQLTLAEALHHEMQYWGVDCLALAPGATVSERISYGMPARRVVASALRNLGRVPSVIPGMRNRLRMFYLRQIRLRRGMVKVCGRFQYAHLKRKPWLDNPTASGADDSLY
ncbi:MAG: SDR family NAD(P)-dependent oxidoreductase [Spongiibacteraceae bacterium]|jgi:short-subunit dehydrogenase|nr:SDR family NAD(P)-dependent oxidoreductase [Spongiibacteraceae bacterium]